MRRFAIVLVMISCGMAGCASKEPMTSHGQPISHWIEKIQDPDAKTRLRAVKALANVGAKDPAVVPTLTGAVTDKDDDVRLEAILGLLRIGPPARAAVPALMQAQQDPNSKVREGATKAIEKIQG